MKIEEAKERIKELERYIELVEKYEPITMEQEAIKLYVLLENVTKVTKKLNEKGYKIENRKLVTTDVSKILKTKPTDELHELAHKMFRKNRRRSQRRGWL